MATEHQQGIENEPSLRQFFINFRTMEPRLRILTGIVTAQVLVSIVLLLLRDFTMWPLSFRLLSIFGTVTISTPHYLSVCIFVVIAFGLFVLGLMEADWRGAISMVGLVGATVLAGLASGLLSVPMGAIGAGKFAMGILYALCIPALWSLSIFFVQAYRRAATSQREMIWRLLSSFYFVLTFSFISFLTIYLLMWNEINFAMFLILFLLPLALLFMYAAIDWAEIADTIVRGWVTGLRLQESDTTLRFTSALTTISIRGFNFPAHRNLGVSEGVEDLLR